MAEKKSNTSLNSGSPHVSTSVKPNRNQNPYSTLADAQQSYQNYWQSAWSVNSLYTGGASTVPPTPHYPRSAYAPYQAHYYTLPVRPAALAAISSASSTIGPFVTASQATSFEKMEIDEDLNVSSLPLPKYEHWDEAVRAFLKDAGLIQALRGFECDMVMMNSQWERAQVPTALENLIEGLGSTCEFRSSKGEKREASSIPSPAEVQDSAEPEVDRSLEERKLDYVQLSTGEKARTPTSINKEISAFLARNRARNDASNRTEFLLSLSEKRKRQESGNGPEDGTIPSCARTDAKTIDREAQMKYDIAKNDNGPLSRTKARKSNSRQPEPQTTSDGRARDPTVVPSDENALPRHHPGVDERLTDIETHLAVRYVPSPPRTLWTRLKFIEDHIIRLEKDYPPWAALHFNQPNRGWPPPPRTTPIIVPPRLRGSDVDTHKLNPNGSQAGQQSLASMPPVVPTGGTKFRNTKSSLQKAVMEQLEVKQAMGENADPGT